MAWPVGEKRNVNTLPGMATENVDIGPQSTISDEQQESLRLSVSFSLSADSVLFWNKSPVRRRVGRGRELLS